MVQDAPASVAQDAPASVAQDAPASARGLFRRAQVKSWGESRLNLG